MSFRNFEIEESKEESQPKSFQRLFCCVKRQKDFNLCTLRFHDPEQEKGFIYKQIISRKYGMFVMIQIELILNLAYSGDDYIPNAKTLRYSLIALSELLWFFVYFHKK